MSPKILVAFFTGAMIAAGIVYVAVRPDTPPKPVTVIAANVAANTKTPLPPPPSPAVVAQPVTVETPAVAAPTKAVREKPSPLIPPVRHERPVTIAQNREPAPQVPPPMREPINKERPYNDAKPADPAPETGHGSSGHL